MNDVLTDVSVFTLSDAEATGATDAAEAPRALDRPALNCSGPPILPIVAPTQPGMASIYRLAMLGRPLSYAIHWPSKGDRQAKLPDAAKRVRCSGPGCELCSRGFTRQRFSAMLVIDLLEDRITVASLSEAATEALGVACFGFLDTVDADWRKDGFAEAWPELYAAGKHCPAVELTAVRTPRGPRYSGKIEAQHYGWPGNPDSLPLMPWLRTPDGERWWERVKRRSNPRFFDEQMKLISGFDPLTVVFADERA